MNQVTSFVFVLVVQVLASVGAASANAQAVNVSSRNPDLAAIRRNIEVTNQAFAKAMASGDSATLVDFYHANAVIYPPNMGVLKSRFEMGAMVKALPGMGIKSMTLNTVDLESSGDMLLETGTYEMSDGSKAVDKGKYLVVWKMEGGKWKLYRDIWNSDVAAGGH